METGGDFCSRLSSGDRFPQGSPCPPVLSTRRGLGWVRIFLPKSPPQEIPHAFFPNGKFLLRVHHSLSRGLWAGFWTFPFHSHPFLSHKFPASAWPSPDKAPSRLGRKRGVGGASSYLGCWLNSPSSFPPPTPKTLKKPKENESNVPSHKPTASSPDWFLALWLLIRLFTSDLQGPSLHQTLP